MEKKKLLLVAVSVGVVLFIIISIPLLIVSPRQNPTPNAPQITAPPSVQERFAVVEASRLPQAAPEVTPPATSIAVDNTQNIKAPSEPAGIAPSTPAEIPQVTTITVEAPRTVAVPSTPVTRAQQPAPAPSKPTQAAAAAPAKAPVVAEKPAPVAKEAPKPAAPVAAKPRVEASKPASNDYWVQTGAFSTQVRAEGAKASLASKGIASVIENRDIDGKTWYRVRVGPYVSETEAGYWLALVKAIDGFADSQIRQAPAVVSVR